LIVIYRNVQPRAVMRVNQIRPSTSFPFAMATT
jgi:hypothetical protein